MAVVLSFHLGVVVVSSHDEFGFHVGFVVVHLGVIVVDSHLSVVGFHRGFVVVHSGAVLVDSHVLVVGSHVGVVVVHSGGEVVGSHLLVVRFHVDFVVASPHPFSLLLLGFSPEAYDFDSVLSQTPTSSATQKNMMTRLNK